VEQDFVAAYMWCSLAVSRYPASEDHLRGKVKANMELAASMMTPDQTAQALKLAKEWKPKA